MSKAYDNAKELNFINFDSANNRLNFGLPITSNGANISTDITVYGANSTSNTYFALPTGNLVSRPASPPLGAMRYNTTNGWPEVYTTNGWQAFAAQPYIISVSPTVIAGNSGAVIDIYGINFGVEAQVYFIDNFNNAYLANTVTYYSNTHISAPTPRDFTIGVEPLDVKVVQNSGMYTLENAIDCGTVPTWVTTAGSLGSIFGANTVNVYVSATDAEGSAVTYSLTSGGLPSGLSLSSNGLVQGVATGVQATTTYNFTIKASDVVTNNVDRAFSYQILNRVPVFNTSPTLSNITDSMLDNYSANVSVNAYDPDGGSVTYAVTVGSVPTGFTFNTSNGALQLTNANTAETTTNTTSTFTISATDVGSGVETRQFNITVEHPKDQDFPNTVLLLSSTESNTIIKDASSNNLNLVVAGDARATNFSPYNSSWSIYLDGSSALSISDNAAFDLGSTDFTVEAWIYRTGGGDRVSSVVFNQSVSNATSDSAFYFGAGSDGFSLVLSTTGSSWTDNYQTGVAAPLNTWSHVVWQRRSNVLEIYLNGVLQSAVLGSSAFSGTVFNSTRVVNIGCQSATNASPFNGYISNLRLVKGTAVYTGAFTPPTSQLTAITNTSLLTCQSNRFADSNNRYTFSITGGTPRVVGWSPFPEIDTSNGSMYFDGTGDVVTFTIPGFSSYTGDFTLEWWVYQPSTSFGHIFGSWNSTNLQVGSHGSFYNGGIVLSGPATGFQAYQWNHVALVRSGSTLSRYVNGTRTDTTTHSSAVDFSVERIGTNTAGGETLTGYVSNIRFTDNAVYSGASITVPTIPLSNIANTKLLIFQNRQPHNNHGFQDSSNNKHLITRVGNPSQGTFSPFSIESGKWGNYFDGSNDYLAIASNSAFHLVSSAVDFTIEAWIYPTTSKYQVIGAVWGQTAGTDSYIFRLGSSNELCFDWAPFSTGATFITAGAVPLNRWSHVAVTRQGNNFRLFINGNQTGATATNASTVSASDRLTIGYYGNGAGASATSYWSGYISNFRLIKGTALYTANTVIDSQPLIAVTNTSVLTCLTNRFNDISNNNFTVTAFDGPTVLPFSPFSPNSVYTTANTGGSVYMDGSGDYLSIASNPNLAIGTVDFTVEYWAYPTAFGTSRSHIMWVTVGDYLALYTNSSGNLVLDRYGAQTLVSATSNALVLNSWNHVVCSRVGTTLRIFINGVQGASITNSTNWATTEVQIGNNGQTAYFLGYMCGMRVLKGTGVSSVTIPTVPFTPVANTILLLNFDNAAIDDYTSENNFETAGDARISQTQSKFAGKSLYFDGTGDYLSRPSSPLFAFGTGDFTIEFWYYKSANGVNGYDGAISTCTDGNGSNGFFLELSSTRGFGFFISTTGYTNTTTTWINDSTWHHLALTRSSGTLRFFIDGVSRALNSTSSTQNITSTGPVLIGSYPSTGSTPFYHFNGYIDDLRVTRTARYTTNFTPRPRKLPRR